MCENRIWEFSPEGTAEPKFGNGVVTQPLESTEVNCRDGD
jgi:hypothetical protein